MHAWQRTFLLRTVTDRSSCNNKAEVTPDSVRLTLPKGANYPRKLVRYAIRGCPFAELLNSNCKPICVPIGDMEDLFHLISNEELPRLQEAWHYMSLSERGLCHHNICYLAAREGLTEVLLMVQRRSPKASKWSYLASLTAAAHGQVEILQ